MTQISWNEAIPSITSTVGSFPPYAKSVWTGIAIGMSVEHLWDGTGGSSGVSRGDLRPGASRAFFAAQSASSSSFTGKLFFASDVSRLFAYGSNGTYLVGTPFYSDESISGVENPGINTNPSLTSCFRLRQSGTTLMTGGGGQIDFPVPFLSPPRMMVISTRTSVVASVSPLLVTAIRGTITLSSLTWTNPGGSTQVTWEAIGYASSASF